MIHAVAIAAIAAPVLRAIIHRIEARNDWSADQKKWIPWVCVALGGLVVVASALAGLPIDESIILGGSAPGAVVVNELLGTGKKDDAPTNLSHPGPPAILALVLAVSLSACHLSSQTRAGIAFVAVAPSIEAGLGEYAKWRVAEERQIGADVRAACDGRADYPACADAIVKPRRQRLDDVRLAVGTYAAAIDATAAGAAGDVLGAAQRVIAALASIGIRVAQR